MMNFVALFQAAQNSDRILDAGFLHQHLLKTSLKRRVLFQVLTIFVQGSSADTMQFASR